MTAALHQIADGLGDLTGIRIEILPGRLDILTDTPGGFLIGVMADGEGLIVTMGGWHEHFDDAAEALRCVRFGLSERCRLKETRRGNTVSRAELQSLEGTGWETTSETGLILFPFWRRASVELKQNRVIGISGP